MTHASTTRTTLAVWIAAAGLSFCSTLLAQAQQPTDPKAQQIFELTNEDRATHGLQALRWDPALATAAADHADRMKDEKTLSHQYSEEPQLTDRAAKAGAHFQAIAENIAMGPGATAIEKQWMTSVPHRSNILDPQMNSIGIAVIEKHGYLYAVEDFSNAAEALTQDQVEKKVEDLLRDQKIDPSGDRKAAEEACASNDTTPPASQQAGEVRAIVHFQTPDLSQLPGEVSKQLHSAQFTKAAVGACKPEGTQASFTTYRVAILLY